ncbi:MAG: hypothetical protein AABY42_04145 [Nitrospirota bacterium]|jgi:hypothetical protein
MKLLPAVIFIILLFIGGLIFLKGRKVSQKTRSFMGMPFIILLLLGGIFFIILGKIAIFLVMLALAVILLTYKRSA